MILDIYLVIGFIITVSNIKNSEKGNFNTFVDGLATIISFSAIFLFWPCVVIWAILKASHESTKQ